MIQKIKYPLIDDPLTWMASVTVWWMIYLCSFPHFSDASFKISFSSKKYNFWNSIYTILCFRNESQTKVVNGSKTMILAVQMVAVYFLMRI